jgi:hypothetical protein
MICVNIINATAIRNISLQLNENERKILNVTYLKN